MSGSGGKGKGVGVSMGGRRAKGSWVGGVHRRRGERWWGEGGRKVWQDGGRRMWKETRDREGAGKVWQGAGGGEGRGTG